MAAYLITHSLLSSWLHLIRENPYEDLTTEGDPLAEFMLTCTNLAIRKPRMPATRRGRPQEPPSSLRENSLPLLRSSCTSCAGTS